MAIIPLCARLANGQDAACVALKRKYFQQAVLINRTDIDGSTINVQKTDYDTSPYTCSYKVSFDLLPGKTGYRFTGPENGNGYFGRYNKSINDLGIVGYTQEVQMLVVGADEVSKCVLEALDKGSYVVALQFSDGTVEIYGLDNGLSTGDYTYSIAENGGGSLIILSSNENTPENSLPFVYVSSTQGNENEDFDTEFENTSS